MYNDPELNQDVKDLSTDKDVVSAENKVMNDKKINTDAKKIMKDPLVKKDVKAA